MVTTPSLKISCKSVQPFSRNLADKERKKEIARLQYPVPNVQNVTGEQRTLKIESLRRSLFTKRSAYLNASYEVSFDIAHCTHESLVGHSLTVILSRAAR